MKIESAAVAMHASRSYNAEQFQKQESVILPAWMVKGAEEALTPKSIGDQIRELFQALRDGTLGNGTGSVSNSGQLQRTLIERIFGIESDAGSSLSGSGSTALVANNGLYVRRTVTSSFVSEEELTAFSSQGVVATEDGRSFTFQIEFEMSRSFESYTRTTETEVFRVCDPLVLSFDGDPASLTDQKFYFDLDCDGKDEELSHFGGNSGFLALDRNGDGQINNGSELFGARTGDGFAELAAYDEDGNGWIDENDQIFDKLKIWAMGEDGTPHLVDLKEQGIGAVFLGKAKTDFTLKQDGSGQINGLVRQTGVYLNENGTTGIIQHVDFAV